MKLIIENDQGIVKKASFLRNGWEVLVTLNDYLVTQDQDSVKKSVMQSTILESRTTLSKTVAIYMRIDSRML